MVVLRCVSRSIVLDSRLRSLSRCTLTAGRKQNPQKVESTPCHMITKQRRRKYSLIMGVLFAIHQKPNKTEAEQMRTFLPDCFSFPQRHDSRSRSPHKTQAADSLLFFAAFNRKRAAILKPSLFQKNTSSNCTIQRTIFYAIFYCLFFNLFLHFWLLCGIL